MFYDDQLWNSTSIDYWPATMRSPPSACLVHDKVLTEDKILMKQRDQSLTPSEDAVWSKIGLAISIFSFWSVRRPKWLLWNPLKSMFDSNIISSLKKLSNVTSIIRSKWNNIAVPVHKQQQRVRHIEFFKREKARRMLSNNSVTLLT